MKDAHSILITCDFQGGNCGILSLVFFLFYRNITTYGAPQSKVTLSVEPTEVKMCLHSFALVSHMYTAHYQRRLRTECLPDYFIDFIALLCHFLSISWFLCRIIQFG